ncbi:MAG: tetratricopeptide repeat protein, partial [Candidatus Eisenbacteria bacterium]|nr:tetratricopeptide repeat protein [Candidatus Eisenbacteria bacterium]
MHAASFGPTWLFCLLILAMASSIAPAAADTGSDALADSVASVRAMVEQRNYGEAEPLLRRLLPRLEAEYGEISKEVASAIDDLIVCLLQTGKSQTPETQALARRGLEVHEQAYGPDAIEVTTPLLRLAILRAIGGEYAAAESAFVRVLEIRESHLPPNDPMIGESLAALGNIRYALSDFAGASAYNQRALEIAKANDMETAPFGITVRGNVANALIRLGDYRRARPILETQIAMLEESGEQPDNLAYAQSLLANVLTYLGDHQEALRLRRSCLELRRGIYPEQHPRIAEALLNLGNTYSSLGRLAEAREAIEEAAEIWESLYGPDHLHVSSFQEALGRLALEQGRLEEARELFRRVLEIREAQLGEDLPLTASALQSLSRVALRQGEVDSARVQLRRALAITRRHVGAEHPLMAECGSELALADYFAGDGSSARAQAETAEAVFQRHLHLTMGVLPEREALRLAQERPPSLDLLLSLLDEESDDATIRAAWDAVIRARAVVFDEMAARVQRRAAAARAGRARSAERQAYRSAATRLANLTVQGPQDLEPQAYRDLLAEARREMEAAERDLATDAFGAEMPHEDPPVDLAAVAAALPPNHALVAFVRYARHVAAEGFDPEPPAAYRAFLLTDLEARPVTIDLGAADRIDALVANWRQEAAVGALRQGRSAAEALADCRAAGARLRAAVWDPLCARLGDVERILVVPDGQLCLLSLAA